VKLALFLDADAGGDFSTKDLGDFDDPRKLVYLKNISSDSHVGIALISDLSYYESYQISHFYQPFTPDNSNITGDGESARMWLLKDKLNTGICYGRNRSEASDLTMTLVSNLGAIGSGNKKVVYAIAVGINLLDLQNAIDDAAQFAVTATP
jgi:hypothetical protein